MAARTWGVRDGWVCFFRSGPGAGGGRRGGWGGAAAGGGWAWAGGGAGPGLAAIPGRPAARFGERRGGVHPSERGVGAPGVALAAADGHGQAGAGAGRVPGGGGGASVPRRAERLVLRAE